MNINARAQSLIQRISTDIAGAGTSIMFVKPDNSLTKTVKAIATKHMIKTDENGFKSVAKTASIGVSEAALIAAGYPTRDSNGEISLLQHRVSWADVSGLTWTYTVRQNRPDEAVGLVMLILDDYQTPVTPDRIITGWIPSSIIVNVTATPSGNTQTLANGDVILTDYSMNADRTITIPYMVGYSALSKFYLNGREIQDVIYNKPTGKFNNAFHGGFNNGNSIKFDASIPTWG